MNDLSIVLRPHISDDFEFKCCDVKMCLSAPGLKEGEELAKIWPVNAGIPFAEFIPCCEEGSARGVSARDDNGILPLKLSELPEKGFAHVTEKLVWTPLRSTEGNVSLEYTFLPRDMSDVHRSHPLFDTIAEENGAIFFGTTTLLKVPEDKYRIHIKWDKSCMPKGANVSAIKSKESEFTFEGSPKDYTETIFIAGKFNCICDDSGKYNVYFLDPNVPEDEKEKIRTKIPPMIKAMCDFFEDPDISYNVFFRKEPFPVSNGGTSFPGGFAYGYSNEMPLLIDKAWNTLAHEMVHNWTPTDDLDSAGDWYSEGTAELYSMTVPYNAGICSADDFAGELTAKMVNYFNNTCRTMTNDEAAVIYWQNNMAQRLPYGRGLVYLIQTSQKIADKTNGAKSIDDVVLRVVRERRAGKKVKSEDIKGYIVEILGPDAGEEFDAVMNGAEMQASEDWFNGAFTFSKGFLDDGKYGKYDDALIFKAVKSGSK